MNEQMRVNQLSVDAMNINEGDKDFNKISHQQISAAGGIYTSQQSLSQGINLLVGKIQDVLGVEKLNNAVNQSSQPYIAIGKQQYQPTNSIERDIFFIVKNINGDLYSRVSTFGQDFTDQKIQQIGLKLKYLTGVSIAVMGLILLSGFIIIPLFGRIQNRILELMKLFFSIERSIKVTIIDRISTFQKSYFQFQAKKNIHQLNKTILARQITNASQMSRTNNEIGQTQDKVAIKGLPLLRLSPIREDPLQDENEMMEFYTQTINKKRQQADKDKKMQTVFNLRNQETISKSHKKKESNSSQVKYQSDLRTDSVIGQDDHGLKKVGNLKSKFKQKQPKQRKQSKKKTVKGKAGLELDEERKSDDESYKDHNEIIFTIKEDEKNNQLAEISEANHLANIEQLAEQDKEVINEFKKYTNKRKLIQGFAIFWLLLCMISYFLITYILSVKQYDLMRNSVDDLYVIFSRLGCSQNILNSLLESYYLDPLTQSTYSSNDINLNIEKCLLSEQNFKESVLQERPIYLQSAMTLIRDVEDGKFCEQIYSQNSNGSGSDSSNSREKYYGNVKTSYQECLTISDQIRKQGLSTFYFDIIRSVKQMQLEALPAFTSKNQTLMLNVAKSQINQKISNYVDIIIKIILEPQIIIEEKSIQSIVEYFQTQALSFIIIFSVYITMTLIVATFFIFSLYKKLKMEMIASNRLLYIIDFESLNELERQVILKFLINY